MFNCLKTSYDASAFLCFEMHYVNSCHIMKCEKNILMVAKLCKIESKNKNVYCYVNGKMKSNHTFILRGMLDDVD